jgi:nanoRNase/pAp phosphatase (c-di-AMP/oligoRNAs hydrolase)
MAVEAFSRALADAIKKYRNILIVIKGSPDPDAIASSYALSVICSHMNVSSSIVAAKKLSLPENRAFVNILEIPLHISPALPDIRQFDAYIVADHQSPAARELTGSLPCAVFIDHHEPAEEEISADFILRETEAGSTSTLIALLLKNLGIELKPSVMTSVATALLYGIYTDTDKYSHAGGLDYEALDYLSKYSDHDLFNKISSTPLSRKTLHLLKKAIENKTSYKDWLITGIGYVDAGSRDSIAIIADFLLKRETFTTVIVFAAIEDAERGRLTLDASFRSTSGFLNLNDIIKKITPEGGARKFKGAYQVNIDYFNHCPDRKLLWNVIYLSTIEMLKKSRDELYITELKGFYQKFRKKMQDYFS